MEIIILAFALWFFLQALTSLLSAASVPSPTSQLAIFAYCLIAGIILLYEAGFLFRAHG